MTMKDFLDRYGPTLAVAVVLTLLVVLLPGNAKEDSVVNVGTDGFSATEGAVASDPALDAPVEGETAVADPAAGTTTATGGTTSGGTTSRTVAAGAAPKPGAAPAAGDVGNNVTVNRPIVNPAAAAKGITFGEGGPDCRADKRQKAIAITAPPCATGWVNGSDNGGATAKGVIRDKVLVTWFQSQPNAATQAALTGAGASDSDEDTARMYKALFKYHNQHFQTYGREIVVQEVKASGANDNEEAMRSDAVKIANQIGAFANYGGPTVLAEELAQRGVVCICTTSLTKDFYTRNPPYIFSGLPTVDEYYINLAEYTGNRLAGKPAKFAGDIQERTKERKFGLIWIEGTGARVSPDAKKAKDFYVSELAKYGVKLSADVSYLFDIARAGEQSTGMIGKMKSAGVNNLLIVGDPLYPIFITQEASRQAYFPEWFISGTGLIDTTFFGRTYDPAQWQNAFGISPLWVFWKTKATSAGYKEYFHGGGTGSEGVAINTIRTAPAIIFAGIQLAGPNLTADNFARGLFSSPAFGGTPSVPKIGFTRESPTAVDDFSEVWWNPNGTGKDEVDKEGKGILMKSNGGQRYLAGQWTRIDPQVFAGAPNSVYTDDNPPGGHHSGHTDDGHSHPATLKCFSCG